MWYISKVERVFGDRSMLKPSILCRYSDGATMDIRVTMINSETNENWVSSPGMPYVSLLERMRSIKPYGFCYFHPDMMFVSVDEPSLAFSSCIEETILLRSPKPSGVVSIISSFKSWCTVWNIAEPLVEINGSQGEFVFPLFQVMCYLGGAHWIDDKFYMRPAVQSMYYGFCVKFRDIERVNLFLTKALVTGYNPVKSWMEQRYKHARGKK